MTILSRTVAAVLTVALMSAGCGITGPDRTGNVTATATDAGVRVANESGNTIQFITVSEAILPLWDPAPCFDGTKVLAGETRTFAWPAAYQNDPSGTKYRFIWWRDTACAFGTDNEPRGGMTIVR